MLLYLFMLANTNDMTIDRFF